jgi:hypothetical protein
LEKKAYDKFDEYLKKQEALIAAGQLDETAREKVVSAQSGKVRRRAAASAFSSPRARVLRQIGHRPGSSARDKLAARREPFLMASGSRQRRAARRPRIRLLRLVFGMGTLARVSPSCCANFR